MRAFLLLLLTALPAAADPLTDLGRALFFDPRLSQGATQSCASCHDPANGFAATVTDGSAFPQGALRGHFGSRVPPALGYGTFAPVLHHVTEDGAPLFLGGDFLDGRATGQAGGDPAAEQALGPLLNPDEMAVPDRVTLAKRACAAQQALFAALDPMACAKDPETALTLLGQALAAFERSDQMARFAAPFDTRPLTKVEAEGRALFEGKAKCAACHVLTAGPGTGRALFTDFSYDNLGVPKNRNNPAYATKGPDWADPGLAATLAADPLYAPFAPANRGRFKVPSLRNSWTGRPRAYMHNGWFTSLDAVVHFYNTRDTLPRCANPVATEAEALAQNCWPAPETPQGVNRDELGDLRLTRAEEAKIVAFLKTLSDP